MVIVAGIDEAGYGPLLGPLVVSAAAFRIPEDKVDLCLWRLLGGAVSRKVRKRGGLVAIADSKKLYSGLRGKDGLEHLERGVLSMLAAAGRRPASLRDLVGCLAPAAVQAAERHPWHAALDLPLPAATGAAGIPLAANALGQALSAAGTGFLGIRCEPVFADEFNRMVQATRNKATTLFDVTCRLILRLWQASPGGLVRLYIDRHGGRMHYLQALQRVFEGCQHKVLREDADASTYRVTDGRRTMELQFAVNAEQRHLAVALASMASKYLRELFMAQFNRYWQGRLPNLAPTGGYYVDGKRFLAEIEPEMRRMGLDESVLCRTR